MSGLPSVEATNADAEVLPLIAELAGLDAVALLVRGPDGSTVRASWPVDRPGADTGDAGEDVCARILAEAGGSGREIVMTAAEAEEGLEALICGSLDPSREVSAETAARIIDGLATLIASRIALEGARRRAEDARTRMAGLVDAGLALGRELALDDLLARIVQSAREVLGARYAALGVVDETSHEVSAFVAAGLTAEQHATIGALPRGRGLLGALIRDARPLRLERITDDPRSEGFPPGHPPMTSFLGVPIALRGEVFGNLYLTDKAGGPFTEEDEQLALTFASQAALAVDNVRRYDDQRRRAGELQSVLEIARAVLGTLDLDALLPLIARRARRLVGADTVGVAVREDDGLAFRHAHGIDALRLEGRRLPADLDELAESVRSTLGRPAVEVYPLEVAGETAGALVAIGQHPFDEAAQRLLKTFSSQAAVAVANAGAVAAERARMQRAAEGEAASAHARAAAEGLRRAVEAQEAERARVARELHDESGQILTALALHLKALEEDVGPGEVRERLAELRRSVGMASTSLRQLATRLRPAALSEQGLADAIQEQAQRLRDAGIAIDVDVRGIGPEVPEEVQTVLFRVVQEALTNVARHSGASNASVLATTARGRLRLVVEDDGCGFESSAPTTRLGLAGIRERVGLLGGELRIESSEGAGTAVVVDLELRP